MNKKDIRNQHKKEESYCSVPLPNRLYLAGSAILAMITLILVAQTKSTIEQYLYFIIGEYAVISGISKISVNKYGVIGEIIVANLYAMAFMFTYNLTE